MTPSCPNVYGIRSAYKLVQYGAKHLSLKIETPVYSPTAIWLTGRIRFLHNHRVPILDHFARRTDAAAAIPPHTAAHDPGNGPGNGTRKKRKRDNPA